MIYPVNFEQKIGFDRLREQVTALCSMQAARDIIAGERFSTSRSDIERKQDIADEMRTLLMLDPDAPRDEFPDMEAVMAKIGVEGAFLTTEEVVILRRALTAVGNMVGFVMNRSEEQYPRLRKRSESVCVFPDVVRRINQLVDDEGQIRDGASPQLVMIRRSIREHEGQVSKRLNQVLNNAKRAGIVDAEAMISIRDGRAVIPVSAGNKRKLNGFIHDESATGKTFYIEPVEVVELNNQLKELEYAERREIVRLLTEFPEELRPDAEPIASAGEYLAEMDAVRAKARWAIENGAGKPIVSTDDRLVLRHAFHPLLAQTLKREKKELVPLDMQLDKQKHILVISGPNAGGKSVCLKTTGMVQYMFQCGFPVTAGEMSELPIFESICLDIGDEQSIEQSLSTFSSHMVNIVEILETLDFESLVLFDELGAGTDPQEGAALAIAILDEVHTRGAKVIATTHYPELKAYGYNKEGVINASVEFDVETLSPTYRLLIGVPGRSNAFEISTKLGLSDRIIRNARGMVGVESNKVENMIASLETSRREAEKDWEEAEAYLKNAERLHKDLQKEMKEYYEKKDALIEKAKQEARELVSQAEKEAEGIISDLRKLRLEKNAEVKEHELIEARRKLTEAKPELTKQVRRSGTSTGERTLKPGDEVKVLSFNQKGTLLEKVSDNEWNVQMGILKMKVKEKDLEFKSSPKPVETRTIASVKGRDFHVNLELDLRGERYESALARVEKYIDDALLAGYPRVSIIHGKGTGALRQGVRDYLKNHRSVKSMRFGEASEGGTGVTVVELK